MRARISEQLRGRRLVGALAGAAVTLALMGYALWSLLGNGQADLTIQRLAERIGPRLLLTVVGIYALLVALTTAGWGSIMGTLSGVWRWEQHFRIYYIAQITRRLPGSLWYMLSRVVMYERLGVARAVTLVGTAVEAATVILGGILVALVTWPLALAATALNPVWLAAGLVVVLAVLHPRMLRALLRRASSVETHGELRYGHIVAWALLYATLWCGGGGLLFLLTTTLHPLPPSAAPAVVGAWAASGVVVYAFSFLPFGFGIQELTLTALLSPLLGPGDAVVVALMMRAALTANEGLWALIAGGLGLLGIARPPRPEGVTPLPDAKKPQGLSDTPPVAPPK